jgi:uncharacterized protein YbbC (DUF1343 family)
MKLAESSLFIATICILMFTFHSQGQHPRGEIAAIKDEAPFQTGAGQTEKYFPLLEGKKIALVVNHTSMVGRWHLLDLLFSKNFEIEKVFGPEHGFRGDMHDGGAVSDTVDPKTGVPVISLYGQKKKPGPEDLEGIEIMVFDIQDVGVRCYTYLSTLTYVMEACAAEGIPLVVLDRPNPNGFYVDGPVLDLKYESFVGMHPIPLVYGMTIGEYARMVNGERWLEEGVQCELTVIPMNGYDRKKLYKLPVKPSPNLPEWQSVYLYPSLVLFEGTIMSVGRGTDFPFQVIGHPGFAIGSFTFMPRSMPGVSLHPKYEGEQCYGQNLTGFAENRERNDHHFTMQYLIGAYAYFSDRNDTVFFTDYFDKLAGTNRLRKDIEKGMSAEEIRSGWQPGHQEFMDIRKKYLQYPDF